MNIELKSLLSQIEELKQKIESYGKFDENLKTKIWDKLRLDWNFHSNHLEGNQLEYGQTKLLLLHGITVGGKPLKDHNEIVGHNQAIKILEEMVRGGEFLTQHNIRHLHEKILPQASYCDSITSNGKPSRKLIEGGKYKTSPNHVLTATGEIFRFAEAFEVPAKMQDLLEWTKEEINKNANPTIIAAKFHYRFIRIHPFDDGNGRMARLLMNFILMKYGLPPVIIKSSDKGNYLLALQKADGLGEDEFTPYIANNLIKSLELMIRALEGENIDEDADLEKEIRLLESEVLNKKNNLEEDIKSLIEVLHKDYRGNFKNFYENKMDVSYEKYFAENKAIITIKHTSFKLNHRLNSVFLIEIFRSHGKIIISYNNCIHSLTYSPALSEQTMVEIIRILKKGHLELIKSMTKKS